MSFDSVISWWSDTPHGVVLAWWEPFWIGAHGDLGMRSIGECSWTLLTDNAGTGRR